jgi:protein involved in polysaccharide export with SLBB domain
MSHEGHIYTSYSIHRRSLFGNRSGLTSLSVIVSFALVLMIASVSLSQTQNSSGPVDENDLIHYGDLIDVDVVGSLEYDWRGSLNPEGFLDGLTLAKEPILALCKSESAVADEITAQYSRILKDPQIVVKVLDRSGRAAALLMGAVRNQQRFKLRREARLRELLALSGGITDTASGEITVFRPAELNCAASTANTNAQTSRMIKISISRLLQGDPEADPVILSGDIITVVQASPIYLIGGVNTPREISSREEVSVSRAIDSAGGLSKEAVESDITIYRRDGKGSKVINVDLKKIHSKQQNDIVLRPFDIVDVGEKGRTKPKFPPNVNGDPVSRDIYKVPVRIIE